MNRSDLQTLARIRLREARRLLDAGLVVGSYHLAGYPVECALKACIARATVRYEFPDKKKANDAWTHRLENLVTVAGLSAALATAKANPVFDANWSIVVKWDESSRYALGITKKDATGLYKAIASRTHGVLRWIRTHW